MSSEIRLKYSGLVIFLSKILSIFTGLVFSIILTHSLSKQEFGAWTNIASVLGTFGILSGVFPFWAARYTARNYEGAMKLGLLSNILIAVPAALVAVVVAPYLAAAANASVTYYLFAAVLIIQSYTIVALDHVVAVFKTHIVGYAFLAFESTKLAIAYLLLVPLHFGILAALLATFTANIGWILIYAVALGGLWSQKLRFQYLWHWIKGSPLNFYGVGAGLFASLEGYILLFRGGSIALAYYGAAALVAGPIGYTISLSAALYPKLLTGGSSDDAETLLRMSLMFSVPLTVATIALASSLLALLNIDYVIAAAILSLLAVRGLISTFASMFDAVTSGTEKLDAKGYFSLGEMVRTRIFLSTTIAYMIFPIYLPLLWIILQRYGGDPLIAARLTALSGLAVTLLSACLKYLISRRSLPFRFPISGVLKFLAVALILISITLFIHQPLNPLLTISVFSIGTGLYFIILYFIDREAKILIRSVWEYTRSMIRGVPIVGRLL